MRPALRTSGDQPTGRRARLKRTIARALALGLALAALTTLTAAACATPAPYSLETAHPELAAQVITRARARAILGGVPLVERRVLDELIFLADLQAASGNESDPLRLYRRVQRELAQPLTVSPVSVQIVLDDMARALARQGRPAEGDAAAGYALVSAMLTSAQGALPSASACLERIAGSPPEVAVAFLVQEYFGDDHYHLHNMRESLVRVLVSGDYGPRPLAVYEDYLRTAWTSRRPESLYAQVAQASQRLLGDDFDAWYRGLRGMSYRRATRGR